MSRISLLVVVFAAVTAAAGRSETLALDLEVGPVKAAHVGNPATVRLELPAAFKDVTDVSLRAGGRDLEWAGQLTPPALLAAAKPAAEGKVARDLTFILPDFRLKDGERIVVKAALDTANKPFGGKRFAWKETPKDHIDLTWGDKPVLRYECRPFDDSTKEKRDESFKVFHQVYDADGTRLLTKGLGGKFPHHRGLFFGFNKVSYDDGKPHLVDIWHCTKDTHQTHEKVLAEEAGPVLGRHRLKLDWHGDGKKVFATEERELTAYRATDAVLVEFASRVKTAGGPIQLDGDPQHAGFHFRADNQVDANSKQTIFIRPDGTDKPGMERNWDGKGNTTHVNLPWLGMSFVLDGQRYTAAYLDRPDNPKEARFSERTYGRFGSYFVYEITDKKPLEVRYRVRLQKGEMKGSEIASQVAAFVEPVAVTVKH